MHFEILSEILSEIVRNLSKKRPNISRPIISRPKFSHPKFLVINVSFAFKIIFNDNFFFVSEHHCVCANVADKTNSVDFKDQLFSLWR